MVKKISILLMYLIIVLVPTLCFGTAYTMYSQGARGMGMANAFTARALDPSAIWYNPAGIVRLEGTQVYAGGLIGFQNSTVSSEIGGFETSTDNDPFLHPHFYLTQQISNDIFAGIGLSEPFDQDTNWPDPSATNPMPYDTKSLYTKTFFVSPVIAVKLANNFSIGAGLNWIWHKGGWEKDINIDSLVKAMSQGLITDVDDVHFRFEADYYNTVSLLLGVQWNITPKITFGASFHSEFDLEFPTSELEFVEPVTGISQIDSILATLFPDYPDEKASGSMGMPAILMAGLAFQVGADLDIEFDFNLATWSNYEYLEVNFSKETSLTTAQGNIPIVKSATYYRYWEDAIALRMGIEYHLDQNIDLRCGALYDQTGKTDYAGPVAMSQDNDRYGFTAGFGYHSGNFVFDVAYMLHYMPEKTFPDDKLFLGIYDITEKAQTDHYFMASLGYAF